MAKQSQTYSNSKSTSRRQTPVYTNGNDEGGRYVDRDLSKVNPSSQQFEPTDSEPVRQHVRMAGGC